MDETNVCLSETALTTLNDGNSSDEAKNCPRVADRIRTRICLIGELSNDAVVCEAAKVFGVPVITSVNGEEYLNDGSWDTLFVLENFDGPVFSAIRASEQRILGPIALRQYAQKNEGLPNNTRPLYCLIMSGVAVCFTGFRRKDDLNRLITLIHNMGGSVRKDMALKVTHLIANCCGGQKYQYAFTFRVPIMSESWIYDLWEKRNDINASATSEEMLQHKLKPFHGARVCFYGFPDEEKKHMIEVLHQNGGVATELEDPACTHVVVDESTVQSIPEKAPLKSPIVKAEWFWVSVQNEGCADEKEYLFEEYLEAMLSPSTRHNTATPSTPMSASTRVRKRKRLREAMSKLVQNESPTVHKRRSSVSDAGLLSMSGSFLDCTASPEKQAGEVETGLSETPNKVLSARQQVFMELVQTESNYVGILHTIMTMFGGILLHHQLQLNQKLDVEVVYLDKSGDDIVVLQMFKDPLEKMTEAEGPLLNNTELKIIFANLPPIYEVHQKMLEELKWAMSHWKEDFSIGKVFLKYAPDLVKAYPPFVNFFETTKEMLVKCDQTKPRFHAFLKICQTKPECGRQSLQELLIRPVQRLPSISLLLNDILKHTSKSNADHAALEQALSSIREVMTHINEDKRKTEGQLVMFDIFNEIDNCPPHIVSSHRSFIVRCDVIELSGAMSGRGDNLVLFLFSDIMEVCKKRSKAFNSLKSPNTVVSQQKQSSGKPYKHICLLPLSAIKRVIDIRETDDCHNVFAFVCRSNQEKREVMFSFILVDEEADKSGFLKALCRQVANTTCTVAENLLMSFDSHQLNIDTSDVTLGTLSKAFKFATRTRLKVGRAFSFNKTPSKFKKAVSTMMSPFGSATNIIPASQLAQMRLASCNNLNEVGGPVKEESTYVAPMSVQPTRKNKCASLNAANLRRL